LNIRGNIEERLSLLDNNDMRYAKYEVRSLDAIVIAAAGLLRLGLDHRITQRIPFEILKPHPLQGSLAVVAKERDFQLLDLLSVIDTHKRVG
jgi:hydroxymethylbilane synthase